MTLRLSTLIGAAAGIALALVLPRAASGQEDNRIVVTPYAGYFVPATKLAHLQGGTANPGMGIRQKDALALGLNATYSFNDRLGVEFGGFYAFSDARSLHGLSGGMPGFGAPTLDAYVIAGSAKLMLNLLPLTERTSLRLGVGPAVIRRDGNAFDATTQGALQGLTDVGGAISLCTRLPLTEVISIRIRAEDYIYQSKLRFIGSSAASDIDFEAKMQNDFIFSAGLQMVFWR